MFGVTADITLFINANERRLINLITFGLISKWTLLLYLLTFSYTYLYLYYTYITISTRLLWFHSLTSLTIKHGILYFLLFFNTIWNTNQKVKLTLLNLYYKQPFVSLSIWDVSDFTLRFKDTQAHIFQVWLSPNASLMSLCLCFCRCASGPGSRRQTEVQEENRRWQQPVSAPTEWLASKKNV